MPESHMSYLVPGLSILALRPTQVDAWAHARFLRDLVRPLCHTGACLHSHTITSEALTELALPTAPEAWDEFQSLLAFADGGPIDLRITSADPRALATILENPVSYCSIFPPRTFARYARACGMHSIHLCRALGLSVAIEIATIEAAFLLEHHANAPCSALTRPSTCTITSVSELGVCDPITCQHADAHDLRTRAALAEIVQDNGFSVTLAGDSTPIVSPQEVASA